MRAVRGIYQAFGLIVLLAVVGAYSDNYDEWRAFKAAFNKTYQSAAEEEHRMAVFLDNSQYIRNHNLKAKTNFIQGINHLSDLTTLELAKRNGFRVSRNHTISEQPLLGGLLETLVHSFSYSMREHNSTTKAWYEILIPRRLDWRLHGVVSRVKEQGECGSCWAHATTGALESVLARRGRPILLSEQNLVDCSRSYGNNGCAGGMMDNAFEYIRDYGIMAAHEYPYTGVDGTCKFRPERSVTKVRGSIVLPSGDEAALRLALALAGPITVAIDASLRSFQYYRSGVYDDYDCKSSIDDVTHAVLLVGYGTDPGAGDYWLLKNSWGRQWGEAGYMRMARNQKNLCGIASYAVLPIP